MEEENTSEISEKQETSQQDIKPELTTNTKKSSKKLFYTILLIALIAIIVIYKQSFTGNVIDNMESTTILLKTTEGDITIELYPDKAPITVENFLNYVQEKSYEETVFHRVIKDFMIQGGGFTEEGTQKPTKNPIKLESDNGLKNEKYTIAMARTIIPDSATNQFFINTNDNDFLNKGAKDEGYAVFGKVIEGFETIDKINRVLTTTKNGMPDWPIKEVKIIQATII